MEALLVAAWLVVAAVLLGPPLLGVHRTAWPVGRPQEDDAPGADASRHDGGRRRATPPGECRVCGEAGQTGYTYCRWCLTPLPRSGGESDADARDGHPAD